jgi:hypothetical protein
MAGMSRRTLGRRVASCEIAPERDGRGRLIFAADALLDLELRHAGRPPASSDAAVRRAALMRADGASLRAIAAALEREGMSAPGGGRWWASSVRNLLTRTAYPEQAARGQ